MYIRRILAVSLAALALLGCSKKPMLFPIAGASADNPAAVARIKEGNLLLRGLDGQTLDTSKIPNPFTDFHYAVTPGSHVLWGMNLPGGNIYVAEGLRCYVFPPVTLEAGMVYRIDEDKERLQAIIKRDDNGALVAAGRLVDRRHAFTDLCDWSKS